MPIPLTPPDDEVGIRIPVYDVIYKGYLYYYIDVKGPPAYFDYVTL